MPPASTTPTMRDGLQASTGADTVLDEFDAPTADSEPSRLSRGEQVGRYVILERVGAGGMGVVYAAYDGDLDRRVALKLLHAWRGPEGTRGQARLLREAQAMAKLAHPNVVAVHEASTHEGQLFIAMEFIDGQTLGQWRKEARRSWREVVAVMRQAGQGLAAAHQQGLVHRDFKPDNVLVGHDGRARVVDFGLARTLGDSTRDELRAEEHLQTPQQVGTRLTQTGALAGTPAYMSPEQFLGQSPDARTDQFSFCVTLWEALHGERPFAGENRTQLAMAVCRGEIRDPPPGDVPFFLRRLMRRGLSTSPSDRFASMHDLLEALAADPGRTRRRVMAAGAAAAGIAVVSAVGARWAGTSDDPCAGGDDQMAAVWGPSQREAIDRAFSQVDAEFATASHTTVQRELDDYAQAWVAGYREACEATAVRHEQSNTLLDRRMTCLQQRRSALQVTVELLGLADREAVARSIQAATSLPKVDECARTEHLMTGFEPPPTEAAAREVERLREQLARAQVLGLTGQAATGLAEAREVHTEALQLGYAPLKAEAGYVVGQLAVAGGHPHDSLSALHDAVDGAIAAGHDKVLVDATTRLISVIGVSLSRYDEAERWGRLATAAVERRGNEPNDTIELDQTLCMMLADKGAAAQALPHCDRALALSTEHNGPEHTITGLAYRALGNAHYAAGDFAAAEEAYQQASTLFLDSHGLDHPEYPALLNALAAVCYSQERGEDCVGLFEQTVQAAERSYGPEHPAVADFTNNLATVQMAAGKLDQAEANAQRSLQLRRARFGDDHPGVGAAHRVLAQVAQQRGDDPGALHHADRAVTILQATRGREHPDVLAALQARAEIRLQAGQIDQGMQDHEDALQLADSGERPALRRAQVRYGLAKALIEHRPQHKPRAQQLAAQARALAGEDPLAERITAWLEQDREDEPSEP